MPTRPSSPNPAPPPVEPIPRQADAGGDDCLRQQPQSHHPRRRKLDSTSRSRLLELPAELRQLILTEALHDPAGVRVTEDRVSSSQLPTLAALVLVSRHVHDEALAVFASCNHFRVDNADGLLFLFQFVGAEGRPQLRHADIAFARPTGCGFVESPAALAKALAMLEEEACSPRLKLTVELSLRAVQAPWNHPHERENEHCHHYPESAKNKAGKNFWIHPASVRDTPHADELKRLVARAVAVRWSGSPQYSWSSAADDSLDFVRKSEEWLRSADDPGFEYVCSWEVLPPAPLSSAKWKDDDGVVRPVAES
ncbi:hypothetical protein BFW01_g3579 [Lasiodiplodia theobromae]|uniref:F-box domain-containing protein n=1 Tax=Lasiodiplodia theobromae TaxID=45133 RepID=A0A5N5D4Z0_9PEZI|nr:uncharacterized protein LTHEOB_8720 [Lasiodiplodia theobromae]KAB2572779.1 hypothetical protein DBV05_g8561 [Lasiodiplodia theobromae]KAF4541324.1 hypothetical protein LTHEOB_8720 [Lasiodiplodia theobromae]KAF9632716.1 hypothetical protein BFW01_g3579 [Lasiodiplodia theobromae]